MKKCIICGRDVYITPKGRPLGMCSTHAYEALIHFLYHQNDEGEIVEAHPKTCRLCRESSDLIGPSEG